MVRGVEEVLLAEEELVLVEHRRLQRLRTLQRVQRELIDCKTSVTTYQDPLRGCRVSEGCNLFKMCSGSEEGSYLRLIDFCITQL